MSPPAPTGAPNVLCWSEILTADIERDEPGLTEELAPRHQEDDRDVTALIVRSPAPVGAPATAVSLWFDEMVDVEAPMLDGSLAAEREAAEAYARMAKAENTWRAYPPRPCGPGASGAASATALPCPGPVPMWPPSWPASAAAALTPETLKLRRAAIRYLHRAAGCPVPTDDVAVSETLSGIHRQPRARALPRARRPRRPPASCGRSWRRSLPTCAASATGALLLVGFAGALRRSELAAIRVEHLEKTERGLRLTLPQTKGSQDRCGDRSPALRPTPSSVRCVPSPPGWRRLELPKARCSGASGSRRKAQPDESPPLPRMGSQAITPWAVAAIVKARAAAAGFGPRDFGGHSLKRGALTTGMDRGEHPAKLKRLGRHKSFDVLGEYLEFGDLFEGHPLTRRSVRGTPRPVATGRAWPRHGGQVEAQGACPEPWS